MSNKDISQLFVKSLQTQKLESSIAKNENKILLKGLIGSSLSFLVSSIFSKNQKLTVLILENKETAAYYFNDLEKLNNDNVLFYPESYKNPYATSNTDNSNILLRADVLNKINSNPNNYLVVTHYKALFEKVVTKSELQKNTLNIKVEDELSIDFINEILFEYEFSRVDFVTQPVNGGSINLNSNNYNEGEILKLEASPSENYSFDFWSGDFNSNKPIIDLNVDSDKTIIANFSKKR